MTTADDVVDPGDGKLSLREAVAKANATPALDAIEFNSSLEGQTLNLTNCELAITSVVGQARDELAGRAVAAQERPPVILEVGEFRAADETGLLDLPQADPTPQVGHLARAVERPEQRPRVRLGRIKAGGCVPEHADVRETTEAVPHGSRDSPARAHDPPHLTHRQLRLRHELQHEEREGAIERVIRVRKCTSAAQLHLNAWIR